MFTRTLLPLRSLTVNTTRLAATTTTSTTTASSQMIRTPIPLFGMDGRYVSALWSAASRQKKLETVDKELKILYELSQKNKIFQEFLFNPLIKSFEKKDTLNKALPSLKLSDLTLNLVGVMAENGRIKLLPAVAKGFNRIMAISRGEHEVTVTTAKPIDATAKKEIEQSLNGFISGGKLILTMKVDPRILGGMLVDFGGEHYIDMSIRSKFNFYEKLIKQAV